MESFVMFIDGVGTSTAQNVLSYTPEWVEKVGFDMDPNQAGKFMCDHFYVCPPAKSDEYIPFIKEKIEAFSSKGYYVPIIDYGFMKLAQNKDNIKDTFVVISDEDSINICDDKAFMNMYFSLFSDVRPFKLPLDSSDFRIEAFSLGRKVITKPRREGRGSLGVSICRDVKELAIQSNILGENFYAQEFIDGREVTVDAFCNLDGTYIDSICRERLEVKAGVCSKAHIFKSREFEDAVKYILKKVKIVGACNIQFIQNDEAIYLIEINPRFSGGLNLSIKAGFNAPKLLAFLVRNKVFDVRSRNLEFGDFLSYQEGYAYKYSQAFFERA